MGPELKENSYMASPNEIDDIRANSRQRDMILAPNEYAFISDETKGDVSVFVGPNKTSLAGTDRPVVFDNKSKKFRAVGLADATQTFQTAPEGWYIVLKNPSENDKLPGGGSGKLTTPTLRVGKKINVPGPVSFPLWPGQMAKVVQGHNLRSNEYLLVRVYDEEAAKANWTKAVIKTQTDVTTEGETPATEKEKAKASKKAEAAKLAFDIPSEKDLTMGKLFVIRGVDVSFYMPPTGLEVVPEIVSGNERYVREAVTLERLEYCLLLDQNGLKRYVHGPDVVFPKPTEKFVEAAIKSNPDTAKAKKFRAQELTPFVGIHIRVIADYTDDTGVARKAGDELFITGKEQTIYFPREEHAIIKYGDQELHYGVAIPAGEARYVLDRESGVISLVNGPQIFLPDPRRQVIAQRALDLKLCELIYPGNEEALAINAERLGIEDVDFTAGGGGASYLNATREMSSYAATAAVVNDTGSNRRVMIRGASKALPGDAFDRKNKFTAPRSIVLNTKYDGAVQTTIWTGFAMLLIRKSGERRVVQGPGTFMLEYDESPQVITLSRGKPKTMDNPLRTVFLQTTANMVSDIVEVETKDFCRLNVKLSYRVNFEGDSNRWFNVDNYVKFLCDHMRSKIRNAVQKLDVQEFYGNNTDILRDVVLGKLPAETEGKKVARAGFTFSENGMRIYDLEVLGVAMQNSDVEKLLVGAQREVIQNTLNLAKANRDLSFVKESEDLKRQVALAQAETQRAQMALQTETAKLKLELDLTMIEANARAEAERIANQLKSEQAKAEVVAVQAKVQSDNDEARLVIARKTQEIELQKLQAQVQAIVDKAKALQPDFIAALNSFGERAMVEKVSAAMAPMALIGGNSVMDVLKKLLEGTTLSKHLTASEPAALSNGRTSA